MIEIVNKKDLFKIIEDDLDISLWSFVESDFGESFLSEEQINAVKDLFKNVNYKHKNDGNFLNNLRNIFTSDNICKLIENQEDKGAIKLGEEIIIVRHSDFGVNFAISSTQNNLNNLTEKQWLNFEKMIVALEVAFNNAKDFHLLNDFDKMNNELKINDSKIIIKKI